MKMRLGVGAKINGTLVILLSAGIMGTVALSTSLFSDDLEGQIRREVLDTSTMISERIQSELLYLVEKSQLIGSASLEEFKYSEDRAAFIKDSLKQDTRFLKISMWGPNNKKMWSIYRDASLAVPEESASANRMPAESSAPDVNKTEVKKNDFAGYPDNIVVHSKEDLEFINHKVMQLNIPLVKASDGKVTHQIRVKLDSAKVLDQIQDTTGTANLIVNKEMIILASSEPDLYAVGDDFGLSSLGLLSMRSTMPLGQLEFETKNGEKRSGAFHRINLGDLQVMSLTTTDRSWHALKKLFKRALLMGGIFLFLAIAAGLRFSSSLSVPLSALKIASDHIRRGEFSVRIKSPKQWFSSYFKGDEITQVTKVFNKMAEGLGEREKMKNLIEKFHSKKIAEQLLSGEIKLGGIMFEATVCFIDIRGFTTISENHEPEVVVHMLNTYLESTVDIITQHGGVVDKFLGDGIMVLWGVPDQQHDHTIHAVEACLALREHLDVLNAKFEEQNLPALKVGMGLHFGKLIAGNIGSSTRMEYTAIGDTVNTSARIQDLTKKYECDLLISEDVKDKINQQFQLESVGVSPIRGKNESFELFKVIGKAQKLSMSDAA